MDYNRDPNIKAFKRRGFVNHGPTLVRPRKCKMHRTRVNPETADVKPANHNTALPRVDKFKQKGDKQAEASVNLHGSSDLGGVGHTRIQASK